MKLAEKLRKPAPRGLAWVALALGTALLAALLWQLDVEYQGHLLGLM